MRWIGLMSVVALVCANSRPASAGLVPQDPGRAGQVSVRIDSVRHLVIVRSGPWDVPKSEGGHDHAHMDMDMSDGVAMEEAPQQAFTWPVNGWVRGVALRILGPDGRPLPRSLLHHINVINFGRRELFYPEAEQLIGIGRETPDTRLPASIGIPVTAGSPMAVKFMWFNETGAAQRGVSIELAIEWSSTKLVPKPVSVMPVYLSVLDLSHDPNFDVPPGVTEFTAEFTPPVGGRILAAGGHLHDYGTGLVLQDVTGPRPREVMRVAANLDGDGHIRGVQTILPGVTGAGIRMDAGHRYRLIARYDNPTGARLDKAAMAHLGMVFAPDHLDRWPGRGSTPCASTGR